MESLGAIRPETFTKGQSMKTKQASSIAHAVSAMFAAFAGLVKVEKADYMAVAAVVKAAPLNDADYCKALRAELFAKFGEAHKDAAQIRWNIINNARRVAYGGSRDGKAIRGKGHAAMLEVLTSTDSVRELKRAMADAVPAQLKGESGGDRKSGKSGKSGKLANPLSVPKVATREEAFAAARKVLEFVRDKFIKPSETDVTERINKVLECFTK